MMNVTMHYEHGIEVFDTGDRTDATAFAGNVLTNWSLNLEEARSGDPIGGKRLWLNLYTHQIPQANAKETGPHGLLAARRKDGLSFLLADEGDVDRLVKVSVDGSTAMLRIGGELMNATMFAHAADIVFSYAPNAVAVRRYLEAAIGERLDGDPVQEICAMMGLSPDAYADIEEAQRSNEGA